MNLFMIGLASARRRRVLAWALYDWANSAFATTVMAAFFPAFFKSYWSAGVPVTESTFRLGAANSVASVFIAVLAPVLGAVADAGGTRRRLLGLFAFVGVASTAALFGVAQGAWLPATVLFGLALVGFTGANVFYDALIVSVAEPRRFDRVSALGYALGYLGGGLLFAVNVAMYRWPQAFGLPDPATAIRVAFLTVAGWWALFSLPVLLLVPEPPAPEHVRGLAVVRRGLARVVRTFREARTLRPVLLFLVAYWLYMDGVDTIIRMAVDYGLSVGLPESTPIVALLVVQLVGFPAALAFGLLGERIGTRRGILLGLSVYVAVTVYAYFLDAAWEFYVLAVAVGLVQGGVQSLSRAFYARLVPPERSAELFGLYNMLGKFAAVVGPVLVGTVGVLTGSARLGILSVLVLFAAGGAVLLRVPEPTRG